MGYDDWSDVITALASMVVLAFMTVGVITQISLDKTPELENVLSERSDTETSLEHNPTDMAYTAVIYVYLIIYV
jgi:hypothetical protein